MSMRIRAASRARRLAALSLGLAALVLMPTVASVGQTEAAWVNSEYATTTVTAATVASLTKGTCVLNAAGTTATVNWTNGAASGTTIAPTQWVTTVTLNGAAAPSPAVQTGTNVTSVVFNSSSYEGGLFGQEYAYSIVGTVGTFQTPAITGTFRIRSLGLGTFSRCA